MRTKSHKATCFAQVPSNLSIATVKNKTAFNEQNEQQQQQQKNAQCNWLIMNEEDSRGNCLCTESELLQLKCMHTTLQMNMRLFNFLYCVCIVAGFFSILFFFFSYRPGSEWVLTTRHHIVKKKQKQHQNLG